MSCNHRLTGFYVEQTLPPASANSSLLTHPSSPSVFVEGGDIRGSNAGSITHSPAFLTGLGLRIPFHKHLSLALTPAEYALVDTAKGVATTSTPKSASATRSEMGSCGNHPAECWQNGSRNSLHWK
jgi:hypothetical protein